MKRLDRAASLPDMTTLPEASTSKSRKGKQKEVRGANLRDMPIPTPEMPQPPTAWWLDVSNPTWEDMRAIGRVRMYFFVLQYNVSLLSEEDASFASPYSRRYPGTGSSREIGAFPTIRVLLCCFPCNRETVEVEGR
jgi:hypothetical protein